MHHVTTMKGWERLGFWGVGEYREMVGFGQKAGADCLKNRQKKIKGKNYP